MKGIKKGYKSKKNHARSSDHIFGPRDTDQQLQARKSGPGEFSHGTGRFAFRFCIKVQEHVHPQFSLQTLYHPVNESVLSALSEWVTPVVFHERVTQTGERFAYPLSLADDPLLPEDWRQCEKALFRAPRGRWAAIDYGDADEPGEYKVLFDDSEAEDESPNPDFDQQLDAALAPYVIDDVDHPLARRLRQLLGDLAQTEAHLVWSDVG